MPRKNIRLIWEFGAGMGHVSRLKPLAERMVAKGHDVSCLAIHKKDAAKLLPCPVEQAPWVYIPERRQTTNWIGHLADTLSIFGWSNADHLRDAVRGWRKILIEMEPDLVVMENAPTAMLASLGLPMKRAWLCDHWGTPPRKDPIPDIQAQITGQTRTILDTEPAVADAINRCLSDQNQPPIANLYELFDRADDNPMLSIPEIDPHGPRHDTDYLGVWGIQTGQAPPWPACEYGPGTPGIFAYLHPFAHRGATLKLLAQCGVPVQVYAPQITKAESALAHSKSLQLYQSPIDWTRKQQSTAFVICCGANSIAQALQLGIPVLSIPMSLEQVAVAKRASQSGACVVADINQIASIGSSLEKMFSDESVFEAAEQLGKKYKDFDPESAANNLADRLIALC